MSTITLLKKSVIYFLLLALISVGCKKDESSTSPSTNCFLEVTINGHTYNVDGDPIYSFEDQTAICSSKKYMVNSINQIDAADYFFDAYIKTYQLDVDFASSGTGNYHVFNGPFDNNACNLDFQCFLDDNTQSNPNTTLQVGGTHTVTSIIASTASSTDKEYIIEGTFTASFKNSVNAIIPVTGKYRVKVYPLL